MDTMDMGGLRPEVIRERLEETPVMTVGVQDARGPWVAPVIFAFEERTPAFTLYFMSRLSTRHAQAILQRGWMAAALHPCETRPLRGLQMEGPAEVVPWSRLPRVLRLYTHRFPRALPHLSLALFREGDLRFFQFTPVWFGILDEARFGWGVRRVWEVPR